MLVSSRLDPSEKANLPGEIPPTEQSLPSSMKRGLYVQFRDKVNKWVHQNDTTMRIP